MTHTWIITITLFLAGVVPFALAGGLHDDTTVVAVDGWAALSGRCGARLHRAEARLVAASEQ
jgi:hypothetical protein